MKGKLTKEEEKGLKREKKVNLSHNGRINNTGIVTESILENGNIFLPGRQLAG